VRRIAFYGLVYAALASVACNAELSPGGTVFQTASETRAARSARVSYAANFSVVAAEDIPLTAEGVFDYENDRGRMRFDMTGLLEGSSPPPPGAEEVTMIVDGSVLYLHMPFVTANLADPKPWIKIDLDAAAESGRTDLAQFTELGRGDPDQFLELLRGVRNVQDDGEEEVRGIPTTHYSAVLDLARVVESGSQSSRLSAQDLIDRGQRLVPADVWIDEHGRMRRLSYSVALSQDEDPEPGDAAALTVTTELYDFGVEVDVRPPPEDAVLDLLRSSQEQPAS
jgi:hypothetical protein